MWHFMFPFQNLKITLFVCSGIKDYGQLGYGDTENRGDDEEEMGDDLPFVNVNFSVFTDDPTVDPTAEPTVDPTVDPTSDPTTNTTSEPTVDPTTEPATIPVVDFEITSFWIYIFVAIWFFILCLLALICFFYRRISAIQKEITENMSTKPIEMLTEIVGGTDPKDDVVSAPVVEPALARAYDADVLPPVPSAVIVYATERDNKSVDDLEAVPTDWRQWNAVQVLNFVMSSVSDGSLEQYRESIREEVVESEYDGAQGSTDRCPHF